MLYNFLQAQMKNPFRNDWWKTVSKDMKNLNIQMTISEIEAMPKQAYKNLIKSKIHEKSFQYLKEANKKRNGKGREIIYISLIMQPYLSSEDVDVLNIERKTIFQLRTNMYWGAKCNFKNVHTEMKCSACFKSECTQKHLLECQVLIGKNEIVTYLPTYEDIFGGR